MNNNECITKCFKSKTKILHPLYLKPVTSNKPYCLVNTTKYYKKCNLDESIGDISENNINYFIPKIGLNSKIILSSVYNINSWSDLLFFIKKNKDSIEPITLIRLLKFSWITFYNSYRNNIDNIIQSYNIYIDKFTTSNININKIIFTLKKKNIKPSKINEYILKNM